MLNCQQLLAAAFVFILSVSGYQPGELGPSVSQGNEAQAFKQLVNDFDGVRFNYPGSWQQEIIPGVATILSRDGYAKLTVLAQPLDKAGAEEYIFYSNRSLEEGWGGIRLQAQKQLTLKGYQAWQFDWTRQQLAPDDLNCYREYHLLDNKTVYTFMLKSNEANFAAAAAELDDIIHSFETFPATRTLIFPAAPLQQRQVQLEGQSYRLTIPEDKTLWGLLNPHKLGQMEYFTHLVPLEEQLNFKFPLLITYTSLDTRFNMEELHKIYQDKRILMVALQPWWYDQRDDTSLIELIQGQYDHIFREYARQFKSLGGPVFVRFSNEMNGDWSTWSAWYYGKDTDIYKMAWDHVYQIFQAEGADNVLFVFNPHDRSYPDFKWNNHYLYYPGPETVQWIGLTGYNNGTSYLADVWRGFNQIYEPLYREYMYYYPDFPFMIAEFACNEEGGDKGAWLEECFRSLPVRYPNIKIAVWFNQIDGKWLYNLDSSPRSRAAFREGLKLPPYRFEAVTQREEGN